MKKPVERSPKIDNTRNDKRKEWQKPELKRRQTVPRVTNGFVGSFTP